MKKEKEAQEAVVHNTHIFTPKVYFGRNVDMLCMWRRLSWDPVPNERHEDMKDIANCKFFPATGSIPSSVADIFSQVPPEDKYRSQQRVRERYYT